MSESTETTKPEVRGEGQLLQSLVAHWIHEDNLYWTQVRHLLVLQLTAFAAFYAVGVSVLGAIIMLLSAVISGMIFGLADTIRVNRSANADAIRIVSRNLASRETENELQPLLGDSYKTFGLFRYAMHSLEATKDAGRKFQYRIFGLCILTDLVVGLLTIHDLSCGAGWLRYLHEKFIVLAL